MRIIFSSNVTWSVYNFRKGLLQSLQEDGHEVIVIAAADEYADKIVDAGFQLKKINLNNNSTNPFQDLKTIVNYYRIYKALKPDIICHNAIKPNIYGTIAAGMLGIPVVNNISGLGTLFIKKSVSTGIAKVLYKYSQRFATTIFFQNNDDLKLFVDNHLVNENKCSILPGSGIDTNKFKPSKIHSENSGDFEFLFVGRLLLDKGIREFVEASKILKEKYPNIKASILGPFYKSNSTSISETEFKAWIDGGLINYLGSSDNVVQFMANADCIVLPSYREGRSRVLIEASSMAIPIITSDVPGCRDVVTDGYNGYLCKVKNSDDLAAKMEKMYLLSHRERLAMGKNGRERAINEFDEKIVIGLYKETIYSIIK